jgi:hypothetical protein
MGGFWDFLNVAGATKIAIIFGALVLIALTGVGFLTWAASSGETIKLGWPTEISAPESEQLKACRAAQTALHDEIQTLDNERKSSYRAIADDQNALNEVTRLQINTEKQEADSKEISYAGAKMDIDDRITQLKIDIDYRDKVIIFIRQAIADRSQKVLSLCAAIIQAGG